MSCKYCNVDPRHPCRSDREASTCGNVDEDMQGSYIDLDKDEVLKWLRYRVGSNNVAKEAIRTLEPLL